MLGTRLFRLTLARDCLGSVILLGTAFGGAAVHAADALNTEQVEFFEKQVRPVLVKRCYECHSAEAKALKGELRVDSRAGLLRGGESGPALVPGNPDQSPLIEAVRYADGGLQMPPKEKLPENEIAALVEWVKIGAPDPRVEEPGAKATGGALSLEASRDFWSFKPVRDSVPPVVLNKAWAQNQLDRFVLAALEQRGWSPAAPTDRRTWIRRATFDLVGLPPTPSEVDAFLVDKSPDAYARVVDRLLAAPQYGERWGRHWLDVVRYADTSGCNADNPVPAAYRYRNYVIDAFSHDKPFDEFVREQLAGDLLPSQSDEERFEQIIATGYLAISRRYSSLGEEFHLTLDDAVDNLGKAFLGLTVSCARCHNHKFDPIPATDYYALYGILQSTRFAFPGTEIYRHTQDHVALVSAEEYEKTVRPYEEQVRKLDAEIFELYSKKASLDTGAEKNKYDGLWKAAAKKRDELLKQRPSYPQAYATMDGTPVNARLHRKGDHTDLGDEVPRGFLQVLGGQSVPADCTGSGRRELAEWIVDPNNPLTARVMVNRIWLNHFGKGLVRTPNDFGTRGKPPTHPELLDYLAARFVESGWSVKEMHRQIMLSAAYQMSSEERADYVTADPDNELLSHFNRRRLEAEEIRDALLAVSGSLDLSRGGEHPFKPEVQWRYTQHHPFVDDFPTRRRSIYLLQQRIRKQPILEVFDGADTNAATGNRAVSTTAIQALFMLNNPLVDDEAKRLADHVCENATAGRDRAELAFRICLSRPATEPELAEVEGYLAECTAELKQAGVAEANRERLAWSSFVRVLLSSNEFVFID